MRLFHDQINRFHVACPGIDHAKSQFPVRQVFADNGNVPGPGGGILQNKLIDFHPLQGGQQSGIIAGQQDLFLPAPVAAADMDAYSYAVYTFNDPVDQVCCKFQFLTRIPAGGKGGSHEGSAVALPGHHNFG